MNGGSVGVKQRAGSQGSGDPLLRTAPSGGVALTQQVAQAVRACLNSSEGWRGTDGVYGLLAQAPGGVLDLSQQVSLSQDELWRLQIILSDARSGDSRQPLVRKLILGNIDDFEWLCEQWRYLCVGELDLSQLRVRSGGGFQELSIRQLLRLQAPMQSAGRTIAIGTIVLDKSIGLSAQVAQCQRLGQSTDSAGVQIVFVSVDRTAAERDAMVQRAFDELLQGGFTQAEVDALLEDSCFADQRELNLVDRAQGGVGWDGLAQVLASKACPLRHLVLPPPDDPCVRKKVDLQWGSLADRVGPFIQSIVGTPDLKCSQRTPIESIRLQGWSVKALKALWSGSPLRQYAVDWYLVSGTPAGDLDDLLKFLGSEKNWRMEDLHRLTDSQMKWYRHQWWMRLMNGHLPLDLNALLAWPEFGGTCLNFLDRYVTRYCSRAEWLALAGLLRHPRCRLDTLVFNKTGTSGGQGGREEFLSTLVQCGRKLDLRLWSAEAAVPSQKAVRKARWAGFGSSDAQHLARLPVVPRPAPVIVLSVQQIQELKPQLKDLVLQGWVFEDPAGQRPLPAPVDKPRVSRAMETNEGLEMDDALRTATPAQRSAIRAFALALSELDAQSQVEPMPDAAFDGVQPLVERAIHGGNKDLLWGALMRDGQMRDGQFKPLSLAQCRSLVQGPGKPTSSERQQRDKAMWELGTTQDDYKQRLSRHRDAFYVTWDVSVLKACLIDDPCLSPIQRVALNDRMQRLAEMGRCLLERMKPFGSDELSDEPRVFT